MSGWLLIKFNNALVFPDPDPSIINSLYGLYGAYGFIRLCSVSFS